jgi:hypothetical protein
MRATWSIGVNVHEVEVTEVGELGSLVTSLDLSVAEPTVLEVWDPEMGAAFSVLVGHPAGTVLTYQASLEPPYLISSGKATLSTEAIPARHNGELIEYSAHQLIAKAALLPALQTFWSSREPDGSVCWERA